MKPPGDTDSVISVPVFHGSMDYRPQEFLMDRPLLILTRPEKTKKTKRTDLKFRTAY